jgi:hypothetical protein
MTKEQWEAIVEVLDENIALEERFRLKPRFKEFKQDLQAIQVHGNNTTIEELDWNTIDALISEKYELMMRDATVAQVRENGL